MPSELLDAEEALAAIVPEFVITLVLTCDTAVLESWSVLKATEFSTTPAPLLTIISPEFVKLFRLTEDETVE